MTAPPSRLPQATATSPSTCTSYAHAHDALAPLLPILDAFNHRHKNQHRATHWWSSFSLLRRALRALAHDLSSPPPPSSKPNPPRNRQHAACSSSSVGPRARWMAHHLTPRCYLAFSQLAADNQHAPLGLLLLAVLARVHAVLASLLPPADTTAFPTAQAQLPVAAADSSPAGADRGVVIARDGAAPSTPGPSRGGASQRPVKRRAGSPPNSEARAPAEGMEKKKKKSKKSKKGDALADLFGSLT